jgi:conjugal transfer pilus assembly protein TraD
MHSIEANKIVFKYNLLKVFLWMLLACFSIFLMVTSFMVYSLSRWSKLSPWVVIAIGVFSIWNLAAIPNNVFFGDQIHLIYRTQANSIEDNIMLINFMITCSLIIGGFVSLISTTQSKKKILLEPSVLHSNSMGILLGIDLTTQESVFLTDKDANLHTLALGTTGSGKTTAICNIVENTINRGIPTIYLDGKGDMNLANRVYNYSKKKGVPFYLFSMVGSSVKYNPIYSGGYTSKKDRIIELRTWSEEHYKKIAESYLQTIFQILNKLEIKVDLYSLAKYLDLDQLAIIARSHKDQELFASLAKVERYSKDIYSLVAEIENLVNSEIGNLFDCSSGNVLILEKAFKEKAVVYFCLQPLAFPAYASTLGKLIINDLKNLLADQLAKSNKTTIYTIFDEFSVFAGDQIINLINQGREAGMCAVLATQSLADLEAAGGNAFVGQVLNNCNNYLFHRQNNPSDANVIANVIGMRDAYIVTTQQGISKDNIYSQTVRNTKDYLVHPDIIKRLPQGQAILVNKQRFAVNTIRVNLSKI